MALCKVINKEYRLKMQEIYDALDDFFKHLSRPLNDLDDIRESMNCLERVRVDFVKIDFALGLFLLLFSS